MRNTLEAKIEAAAEMICLYERQQRAATTGKDSELIGQKITSLIRAINRLRYEDEQENG